MVHSGGIMMTRRSITAGALVFALAAVQGAWAQAQWGYPVGYGGYGWGGWGGQTVQGGIAGAWGPTLRARAITTSRPPSPNRSTPTRSCGGTSTSTNRR